MSRADLLQDNKIDNIEKKIDQLSGKFNNFIGNHFHTFELSVEKRFSKMENNWWWIKWLLVTLIIPIILLLLK